MSARRLDARRCISYLTIEHEGAIDASLRERMGDWAFGCDVCQDVCPYNHGTRREPGDADLARTSRWDGISAEGLLTSDDDAFARWSEGSPLRRAGAAGLARNVATVLGNVGARRHLPVLREAARSHRDDAVREAAAWAAARIEEREPDET